MQISTQIHLWIDMQAATKDEVTEAIVNIGETGVDGVEVFAEHLELFQESPPELQEHLDEARLDLSGVYYNVDHVEADEYVKRAGQLTEAMDELGSNFLVVGGGRDIEEDETVTAADFEAMASMLNRIADQASEHDVETVIHPHRGQLVETPSDIEALLDGGLDCDQVGLCVHATHQYRIGADPYALYEAYPDWIQYVHVSDENEAYEGAVMGEGDLDLHRLHEPLFNAGYDGWMIIEGRTEGVSTAEYIKASRSYIKTELRRGVREVSSMAKRTYNVGVIGVGTIWNRGHLPAIQTMDEVNVKAVYDLEEESQEEAARQADATAVDNAEAIFEDEAIDIVAILTPPFARVDYVERACAAGKHLMLEKPMARTLEDALTIYDAVQESGVECFIPFSRTTNSPMWDAIDIVNSGLLGEPRVFRHTNLSEPYSWVDMDHWMLTMDQSGGPIFDYSIHFIDLSRVCMDAEAEAVNYSGLATTGRVDSDDHASLAVYYDNNGIGEFTKSWAYPPGVDIHDEGIQVICEEGVVVIRPELEVHTPDGSWTFESTNEGRGGRRATYRSLIAGIEDGEPLLADEEDGLRSIEILDAMLTSRERGKRIDVELHRTGN